MKERENELTTRPNLTNLETGEIFMGESGEGPKPADRETKKPRANPDETSRSIIHAKAEGLADRGDVLTPPVEVGLLNAYGQAMGKRGHTVETTYAPGSGMQKIVIKRGEESESPQTQQKTEQRARIEGILSGAAGRISAESLRKFGRRLNDTHDLKSEVASRRLDRLESDIKKELESPTTQAGSGNGGEKPPKPPTKEGEEQRPEDVNNETEDFASVKRKELVEMRENARAFSERHGFDPEAVNEYLKDAEKAILERVLSNQSRTEAPITVPESLEDLARLIRKRSAPEYRAGGAKDLINEKDGTVNTINFLDWTRENLLAVHNNNPLDPVNFFSDIGTSVRTDLYGGTISFYEITFGKSFFLQDKNGEKVVNKEYEALHDQLYYEAFLLMFFRNPNIEYMHGRGEKDSMMKVMRETFIKNPLTRSNFLEVIMTMPSTTRDSLLDQLPDEEKKKLLDVKTAEHEVVDKTDLLAKREGNFYVGNAVREALSAYINIFDYDQLKKILGEDAPIFKIKSEETGREGLTLTNEQKKDWFNADGTIKLYKINKWNGKAELSTDGTGTAHPLFMEHLNIFMGPTRDQKLQSEIRKLISLSVMKKEGISEKEAEFAELFAYSLTHINGVAARNDVHSVAFDWWTRLTNFKDYRKRQKAERRGAKYGSNYNMEGFKRIGLGFFEAARDLKGRSLRDIIQGGTGKNADIKSNPFKNEIDYEWSYKTNDGGFIQVTEKGKKIVLGSEEDKRDDDKKKVDRRLGIKEIVYDKNNKKFVYLDSQGVALPEALTTNLEPVRDALVMRDLDGKVVDLATKATSYELSKEGKVVFRNEKNEDITEQIGDLRPNTVVLKSSNTLEFKQDLQKQFIPNHLITAGGVYEWIINSIEMNFPEMITGYDTHGNPIVDQKKVDEVKEKIEHDIRYALSTWPEINFDEEDLEWERIEVRNENGQLIARKHGEKIGEDENGNPIYKDLFLDEKDWYILDEKGNKTDERNEPKTFLQSRVMTKLEAMFGVDALRFIQSEIDKRDLSILDSGQREEAIRNGVIKTISDEKGNSVEVDFSKSKDEEFRIAVWRGAFDYLIASEIAGHRDRGSGLRYYNSDDIKKTADALKTGEFVTPDQIKEIRRQTKTKARDVYLPDIGYAFMSGGLSGFWKAFQLAFREALK